MFTYEIYYTYLPITNRALNGYMVSNNRRPSPPKTSRQVYSPIQQQPVHQQPFRSLSTNPTLLRNINETDDEINMIDSEFDRYNQRSFRGKTGTTQRSKYHTVSNDFVDCTKAPATTPVPSSSYTTRPNLRKLIVVVNIFYKGKFALLYTIYELCI